MVWQPVLDEIKMLINEVAISKAISETALIAELAARGLEYIADTANMAAFVEPVPTAALIAGLAQSEDARLHMALIALFLYQPESATAVPAAVALLDENNQTNLKLFYTAAVVLQRIHAGELRQYLSHWQPLPDYFSVSLDLPLTAAPQMQLKQLGRRHQELSGIAANWAGSYQYAADRLLARLAKEALWAA